MSQIDVAPTVLGLMNMSYDTDFMGRDILKESDGASRAFISTYQKLGYLTENHLLVLGPQKYTAQYLADRRSGALEPQPTDDEMLGDMLAYYQGGNYIYKNRLNRIR
jgi:phosphoglycerol transferase MdoB-like AlkP superfamily enzyme